MAKIRGGRIKGGIAGIRKSIKRSSGDNAITRIPKDAPLVVRFAQEPDEWYEFFTHWIEEDKNKGKSIICVAEDCEGCADGVRQSKRFLVNAIDIDNSKVVAVELPVTLVSLLLKRYDKYGTVMDRDYELTKNGTGMDTEYDAISEGRSKFNFDMYELLDLDEILNEQVSGDSEDDEDEDEPLPPPRKKTSSVSKRGGTLRRAPRHKGEEDEDLDEDDEPPFSGGKNLAGRSLAKKTAQVKKALPVKSAPKKLPGKTLRK